jgi:predicted DNA-binding protein YlxM (UPF0122 family)
LKRINKADYALNKSNPVITYRMPGGTTIIVTLKEYLEESLDKTEADFYQLKEFLDNDYLHTKRNESAYWRIVEALKKNNVLAQNEPSAEDEFLNEIYMKEDDKLYHQRVDLSNRIMSLLTPRQERRYRLYYAKGLTTREIARHDGVNQSKIVKSIKQAKKRINVIISILQKQGAQKRRKKIIYRGTYVINGRLPNHGK